MPPSVLVEPPPAPPAEAPAEIAPAPALPRLIFPWSAAGITSRRPAFRWAKRASSTRVTLELCRERACAKPVHTIAADGERASAPGALAPGVWWWRVRDEGEPVAVTATWRFHVGRRDAPVTASLWPRIDVDGDGRVDPVFAIDRSSLSLGGAEVAGAPLRARVFLGKRGGVGDPPVIELAAGAPVAVLGDLDGDGHCDLGLGGAVHAGGPGTFVRTSRALPSGAMIAAGGDVDGDGHADVVVATHEGTAALHLGTSDGLARKATVTLRVANRGRWPNDVALVDVDADGHADLVSASADALLVHRGGPQGFVAPPEVLFGTDDGEHVLGSLASVGDVDGDGYPDVQVSVVGLVGEGPAVVVVVPGGTGARRKPWRLHGTRARPLAGAASGAGDVDGDGFDDLLLATDPFGGLLFFRGGRQGPRAPAPLTLKHAEGSALLLGDQVGDVDGDGLSDVVLGIHTPIDGSTFPALFLGSRAGLRQVGE